MAASAASMFAYGLPGTHHTPSASARRAAISGPNDAVCSHWASRARCASCAARASATGIARCATTASARSPTRTMRTVCDDMGAPVDRSAGSVRHALVGASASIWAGARRRARSRSRRRIVHTLTSDNSARTCCRTTRYQTPDRRTRMADRADLLQGTLDLLILKTLVLGPLHGWAISKRLRQLSDDVLEVGQGSLYPALYRLEDRGWIRAEWGTSPEAGGRRAKFYSLTADGRKQFAAERTQWRLFSTAVERVLKAT